MSITGLGAKYIDNPELWPKLAERLRAAGEFGFDTETYGQPDKTSPQHRSKIHCWSVGVLTDKVSSRGYRRAVGVVVPRAGLDHPDIRAVFSDRFIKKWAHNAPHDYHSAVNEGIEINNIEDSLQWARVVVPGVGDYGLKGMEQWALGLPERPSFLDMVKYIGPVVRVTAKTMKGCVCGAQPCRQRSNKEFLDDTGCYRNHTRVTWRKFTPTTRQVELRYEVTRFVPGACLAELVWPVPGSDKPAVISKSYDRWQEWLDYSLSDAVHGIEVVDWLRNHKRREIVYPWRQ